MTEIRPPAVAGMFYPGDADELREMIARYMADASPETLGPVHAVIVPHAGYVYSGPVAAYAYKLLQSQERQPNRIFLLGPSHRSWFPSVAIADVDGFETPLGVQPVDRAFAQTLAEDSDLFSAITSPHVPEHCLEVQVPFIQTIFPETPIVPMLFGETDPIAVAKALKGHLGDEDLIIVSSDLSHYHDNQRAHAIDQRFLNALLRGDHEGVLHGEACGQAPILTLMTLLEYFDWQPHLLDYRTSGDTAGGQRQVVGYAAVAYVDREKS
ncbi:MAG: AmmeMemoRadiSam system protein B [Anaerolineae bacterium]|nr:AmmeMemoRadiSam system protein B [Anaerolineae bacterium]